MISYRQVHPDHLTNRALPGQEFADLVQNQCGIVIVPGTQPVLIFLAIIRDIGHGAPGWWLALAFIPVRYAALQNLAAYRTRRRQRAVGDVRIKGVQRELPRLPVDRDHVYLREPA